MRLLYDGSFEGFLTIVYKVYYQKIKPVHIDKYQHNTALFDTLDRVETDETQAMRVLEGLHSQWSKKNLQTILTIFMCDSRAFEMDLLQFIILGFRDGKELKNINHPHVFRIRNLEKEYYRYHHRMTGFVRFEELEDGTLYAKIEGRFNILYHLGEHFAKRLNTEKFIIHD
ncbi:MAG TPA: DUF4130 domain-containing protein, partial [Campylobacterales bacterium]|nr:DUF4130 domain-containing protein [Campylobacterales bacterium]